MPDLGDVKKFMKDKSTISLIMDELSYDKLS
jgi:hypothetical protein